MTDAMSQKERDGTFFLIGRYLTMFEMAGIPPAQNEDSYDGLNHAHWMVLQLRKELMANNPKFDDGKVGRWIGFIQAALIMGNLTSVMLERDISRPLFQRSA